MKIWKLENDFGKNEEYYQFQLLENDNKYLEKFNTELAGGTIQNGTYDYVDIKNIGGDVKSDFPKLWNATHTMIFSERAKESLHEILGDAVEYIPILHKKEKYYIVNILSVLDGIDYTNSILEELSTGLVVGIEKYSLLYDKIKKHNIFKLLLNGKVYRTEIFVTSEFKDIVKADKLTGAKFTEVWNADV